MTPPQVPIPHTAIVPAAGLGTRFLPATKTVPKELLPVVDTPGIELVAAEAAEAGAERLIIVTSEGKDSVVAHFVEDLVLEGTLEARGKVSPYLPDRLGARTVGGSATTLGQTRRGQNGQATGDHHHSQGEHDHGRRILTPAGDRAHLPRGAE